jgi:hypothetical protein
VPQGVLCEHVFHNNSWSWGVITHHCHRLHNIPVQFFPSRDPSSSPSTQAAVPLPLPTATTGHRRRPVPPPAGRPDRRRSRR